MQDTREITALMFEDNGRKMCVLVVDQQRIRLLMDGRGPDAGPVEAWDHLLWPALELPEPDLGLNGMFDSPPLMEEIEAAYRGWFTESYRRVLEDGRWTWKGEIQVRHICGPPSALGHPLPTLTLSDGARDAVREYAAQRSARGPACRFGPEAVDEETPAVLYRGLPAQYCTPWDAPPSASADPARRELVVLQGGGERVTLLLRGYARMGGGPLFEMFVPFAEMAEGELGSDDLAKYTSVRTQVRKYGASGAKWVTLAASGEWLSGSVCKVKATGGHDQSPKPAAIPNTIEVVRDYLGWRATAYGQQVNLLTGYTDGKGSLLQFLPEVRSASGATARVAESVV